MAVRDAAPAGPAGPLVLVVDEDRATRRYLRSVLTAQGMRVVEARSAAEALEQAAAHDPSLVLLDFGVPDVGGIAVTTMLRERAATPILILSTRHDESAVVSALDAGANDYLAKPFSTEELLARMRVWLRRARASGDPASATLDAGPLRIDFVRRLAFVHDVEVRLTPTLYKLFATFMRNAGRVLTHEQILLAVWGPAYVRETQYLRVYMGRLRKRFEVDAARPRFFVMEPGVGYRLRIDR
jgi:two-component system KDP operon response regulator KdpE